jgi:hypothetical protein
MKFINSHTLAEGIQSAEDYEALLPWNIDLEKVAAQD